MNTSSDNLVTTFNIPSPLKDRTRSNVHDGSSLLNKIESISPFWQQLLTSSLSHLKYSDQSLKIVTNQWYVLILTKTFTSTNIVVN